MGAPASGLAVFLSSFLSALRTRACLTLLRRASAWSLNTACYITVANNEQKGGTKKFHKKAYLSDYKFFRDFTDWNGLHFMLINGV